MSGDSINPEEKAVVDALANYRKVDFEFSMKIAEARARLYAVGCTHPKSHRRDYTWEHDNGYGRQKLIIGEQCNLCFAKRSWKNMKSRWREVRDE